MSGCAGSRSTRPKGSRISWQPIARKSSSVRRTTSAIGSVSDERAYMDSSTSCAPPCQGATPPSILPRQTPETPAGRRSLHAHDPLPRKPAETVAERTLDRLHRLGLQGQADPVFPVPHARIAAQRDGGMVVRDAVEDRSDRRLADREIHATQVEGCAAIPPGDGFEVHLEEARDAGEQEDLLD